MKKKIDKFSYRTIRKIVIDKVIALTEFFKIVIFILVFSRSLLILIIKRSVYEAYYELKKSCSQSYEDFTQVQSSAKPLLTSFSAYSPIISADRLRSNKQKKKIYYEVKSIMAI